MKAGKLILTALMVFFASVTFAQSEEEEAQLFGNTRGLGKANKIEFGKIANEPISVEKEIKNNNSETISIVGFEVPAGLSAMPKQKTIAPKSSGKVVFTVYPEFVDKDFSKQPVKIKIRSIDEDEGSVILKDIIFQVDVQQ